MLEMLENYSIPEIIGFLVAFALSIKGFVSFWDWGKERLKKVFEKEAKTEKAESEIQNQISQCELTHNVLKQNQDELKEVIDELVKKINILMDSDKDDIKSFITKEHHYFCYQKGWIDDYSMDCIEKRFKHYSDEGGNSFIEEFMEDLRELPRHHNKKYTNK